MKIRTIVFAVITVLLFSGFVLSPVLSYAAQAKNLTKEVMSSTDRSGFSASDQNHNELQVTNPDKKQEVQIRLGDQFKAYILAGASPFKELNGKPVSEDFRAMVGLHIPLK